MRQEDLILNSELRMSREKQCTNITTIHGPTITLSDYTNSRGTIRAIPQVKVALTTIVHADIIKMTRRDPITSLTGPIHIITTPNQADHVVISLDSQDFSRDNRAYDTQLTGILKIPGEENVQQSSYQ